VVVGDAVEAEAGSITEDETHENRSWKLAWSWMPHAEKDMRPL
jgi:hypothetical protein